MPVIKEEEAINHRCPWNEFMPCLGAECMAWARHGRSHEWLDTDNLVDTPDGIRPDDTSAPPKPDGDGWVKDGPEISKGYHRSAKDNLPRGRAQRWVRPVKRVEGHCARAGHGDCGGMW